jgi:hypothetical protein
MVRAPLERRPKKMCGVERLDTASLVEKGELIHSLLFLFGDSRQPAVT